MKCGLLLLLVLLATSAGVFARPTASSGTYSDEFTGTALDARWTWVDPLQDCSYTLTANPGYLRIYVPGDNHDLWPFTNYNAPRVTQSMGGDFTIETRVPFNPQYNGQGAGILVWKDSDNYLRLDRDFGGNDQVEGQYVQLSGEQAGSWHYFASAPYTDTVTYLRLARSGNNFTASYSNDGVSWTPVGSISLPLVDPLGTGLFVIDEWQNNAVQADFDYFRLEANPTVGGIAEAPQLEVNAASGHGGSPAPATVVLAGLAGGGTLLLIAAGWYARRRWLR